MAGAEAVSLSVPAPGGLISGSGGPSDAHTRINWLPRHTIQNLCSHEDTGNDMDTLRSSKNECEMQGWPLEGGPAHRRAPCSTLSASEHGCLQTQGRHRAVSNLLLRPAPLAAVRAAQRDAGLLRRALSRGVG